MSKTVIHLLDSDQGRPLQSWSFEEQDNITLGRADENDVIIADPYVSRAHAYLHREADGWKLTSISRQQVIYQGQAWSELTLQDGTVFRLGPNGCFLRFGESRQTAKNLQTMQFEPTHIPVFQLDREKMESEVSQIATGDYFRQLKQAAQELREQRSAGDAKDA